MTDLTDHKPEWRPGLPPDGADRCWLGESEDGRQWIMQWANNRYCWCLAGFADTWGDGRLEYPEIRAIIVGEKTAFRIVRHMPLPATVKEESAP